MTREQDPVAARQRARAAWNAKLEREAAEGGSPWGIEEEEEEDGEENSD